jgi:hypothetical protein
MLLSRKSEAGNCYQIIYKGLKNMNRIQNKIRRLVASGVSLEQASYTVRREHRRKMDKDKLKQTIIEEEHGKAEDTSAGDEQAPVSKNPPKRGRPAKRASD